MRGAPWALLLTAVYSIENIEVLRSDFKRYFDQYQLAYFKQRGIPKKGYRSQIKVWKSKPISLNESLGILQRSYTRALNKEYGWSGSLFREKCKAKDGWEEKFQTIGDSNFYTGNMYVSNCKEYIEYNPVDGGLVEKPQMWKYSSAVEYFSGVQFPLCDLEFGKRI